MRGLALRYGRVTVTDSEGDMHHEAIRILVVDDEPAICKALSIALTRAGYVVTVALSGDAALARVASERFDAMLVDLRIPDTRGDVLFEITAATQPHLRSSTVFMTGDISDRAIKLIDSCGCPVLRKPFDLQEMIVAIARVTPPRARRALGGQSA